MTSRVTLFVDRKNTSSEAQKLLKAAKIPYETVHSHGVNLPKAQYNHFSYNGIAGVRFLVKSMGK